jgi:hypothetical protein
MLVGGIGGQAREVDGGSRLADVGAPGREVLRQVVYPPLRRLVGQALPLDERTPRLGQQLLAPEEIEQAQIVRDAPHQLMEHAREDDVGVDDRPRRPAALTQAARPASRGRATIPR